MTIYNDDNWVSPTIAYLEELRETYHYNKLDTSSIEALIKYLNKTN